MKTNHRRNFKASTARFKGGTAYFNKTSALADISITAVGAFDASNGHRGLAKSKAGAKKFVNSRFRFHENAATRQQASEAQDED